jgi:hypothetical protein
VTVGLEDGSGSAAVKTRAWFWGIGEGEGRGVDDSVVADQGDGDLDGLTDPAPPLSEGRDVRHHAEHALSTPGTEGVKTKRQIHREIRHLVESALPRKRTRPHVIRLGSVVR